MKYTFLFLTAILISCGAKQAERSSIDSTKPALAAAKPKDQLPPNFKFSLFISGAGMEFEPPDSWTMDTTETILVQTLQPSRNGNKQIHAFATLDPIDMDSLRMMIRFGKLYTIDSADLNQQCGGDGEYTIRLAPLAPVSYLSARFDSCATDYNLLLEPQRKYFHLFVTWWERMRVKYRPVDPG